MMSTFITPKSSLGTLCDLYTLKYIIYLCVYVNISIILTLCIQRQSRQRAGKTYHCGSTWNFRGDGLSVVYPNIAGNATDHGQHRHLASRLFFLFGENVSAMFSVDFFFWDCLLLVDMCHLDREIREKEKESDTYTHSLSCSHIRTRALFLFFLQSVVWKHREQVRPVCATIDGSSRLGHQGTLRWSTSGHRRG